MKQSTQSTGKTYLSDLTQLKNLADQIPNTLMMAQAKVMTLSILNMRYERIMLNRNLDTHPYLLVSRLVREAIAMLSAWQEAAFIENPTAKPHDKSATSLEQDHQELFQKLWIDFSLQEYRNRIERYVHRLRVNSLGDGWLKCFKCIDFGCGHGAFAHALIREGAEYVYAFDFGRASIDYAIKARDELNMSAETIEFVVGSVYSVPREDRSFDFAVQNGVFHHLQNEDVAIREIWRVLKPGGWLWYYTDGAGGISHDLWDASAHILANVPHDVVISCLKSLNIETGKRYHLGDSLQATYRHTTWDELTKRLFSLGFGGFRRLVGGMPTDYDHDVIAGDRYGRDKFGEGDIRLLAQKRE